MKPHTPKPWFINHELSNDDRFVISNKNQGSILVERHVNGHDSEDLGNALLVAAAPDMLAALKFVVTACTYPGCEAFFKGGRPCSICKYVLKSIAKAEGKL